MAHTRAMTTTYRAWDIPKHGARVVAPLLLTRPSFLKGMARTLDVGTTTHLYNRRITATEADLIATYSDWATVGQDLWTAINTYPHGGIVSAN